MPKEKEIQNAIIEYLNYSGCYVWRQNAGKVFVGQGRKQRMIVIGERGISDIIGIRRRDGKFIAIEVKTPIRKKNLTLDQKVFLNTVKQFGGLSGVATSIDEALEIVEEN
jgi:hypothetical protein